MSKIFLFLLVSRLDNILNEAYLELRYASFLTIHHFTRTDSHRLFQVALGEELAVNELLEAQKEAGINNYIRIDDNQFSVRINDR